MLFFSKDVITHQLSKRPHQKYVVNFVKKKHGERTLANARYFVHIAEMYMTKITIRKVCMENVCTVKPQFTGPLEGKGFGPANRGAQ